jgi:hypothetical protein
VVVMVVLVQVQLLLTEILHQEVLVVAAADLQSLLVQQSRYTIIVQSLVVEAVVEAEAQVKEILLVRMEHQDRHIVVTLQVVEVALVEEVVLVVELEVELISIVIMAIFTITPQAVVAVQILVIQVLVEIMRQLDTQNLDMVQTLRPQ